MTHDTTRLGGLMQYRARRSRLCWWFMALPSQPTTLSDLFEVPMSKPQRFWDHTRLGQHLQSLLTLPSDFSGCSSSIWVSKEQAISFTASWDPPDHSSMALKLDLAMESGFQQLFVIYAIFLILQKLSMVYRLIQPWRSRNALWMTKGLWSSIPWLCPSLPICDIGTVGAAWAGTLVHPPRDWPAHVWFLIGALSSFFSHLQPFSQMDGNVDHLFAAFAVMVIGLEPIHLSLLS